MPSKFSTIWSAPQTKSNTRRSPSKDVSTPARDPVRLALLMESPPILLLDTPSQSSGALISGRLQITPIVPELTLECVVMHLECTTSSRGCRRLVSRLCEWHFLTHAKTLQVRDMFEMPFSHVLPGHLPATTHGAIASIDYQLHVRARVRDGHEIDFRRYLVVKRALRPGSDKNSVRVFPPTSLVLHVTLPHVVHPSGEFHVQCRLIGITTKCAETQSRWRLRKLSWRVEEQETVDALASQVGGGGEGEGRSIARHHTRQIGMGHIKDTWKTDLSDGTIDVEFPVSLLPTSNPNCAMHSPNGTKITHRMSLELVIAEEWAPNRKPHQATPTGAAKLLRAHFSLTVTERAGMGIAWDDEQPPIYEDVPASPPHYPSSHPGNKTAASSFPGTCEGPDLITNVEQLSLNS